MAEKATDDPKVWATEKIIKLLMAIDGMDLITALGILDLAKFHLWTDAQNFCEKNNKT